MPSFPILGDYAGGNSCGCTPPGQRAPSLAPYVVSIEGLYGIVDLDGVGAIEISTSGNTIYFSLSADAGLGTVTEVDAAMAAGSEVAMTVSGGPINTFGTLEFTVDPALISIAGLTTAADTGIYTTALDTYATFTLTGVGRTLVGQATQALARTTGLGATTVGSAMFVLTNPSAITFPRFNADNTVTALSAALYRTAIGLEIGVNVQAWSADLDSFVTNASWIGDDLTLVGDLTIGGALAVTGTASFTDLISGQNSLDITGSGSFTGNLSVIGNIIDATWAADTIGVAVGGTGLSSYAVGDLIYASGATTLARRAAVAAGKVLTSQGVGVAPTWDDASNLAINVPASKLLVVSTTGDNALGVRGQFNHQYLNIQNAINAAQSGDTVLVLPGTYTENVELANGVNLVGWGRPTIVGILGCYNANTCEVFNFAVTGNIGVEGGTLVKFWNVTVSQSSAATATIVDSGCTAYFYDCDIQYTNASTSFYALEVSGTVRAQNCRFKSTQASTHAVLIAGNNGQFLNCMLISGSGGTSLSAAAAQTVGILLPCGANTAKDADVTLSPNAGYNVDALNT